MTGRIRDTTLGHKAIVRLVKSGHRVSASQYKSVLNNPLLTTASKQLWERRQNNKYDWLDELSSLPRRLRAMKLTLR